MDVIQPFQQLPASQPEWPGAISSKFADKLHGKVQQKRSYPADLRDGPQSNFARQGPGSYMADQGGLTANTQCKRSIQVPGSQEYEWRAAKKAVGPIPGSDHYVKPQGRRMVEGPTRDVVSMGEKRHIRQVESKEEFSDRPQGLQVIYRSNGLRARDQPAHEIDIGDEMTRKVKHGGLSDLRNGIGCRSLGDKPYRHPEYESQFFKAGCLVVGSGFVRGCYEKTKSRNSNTLILPVDATQRRQMKSYQEKRREQLTMEAQQEVEELTRNWESGTLKGSLPTYDEPVDSDDEQQQAAEG